MHGVVVFEDSEKSLLAGGLGKTQIPTYLGFFPPSSTLKPEFNTSKKNLAVKTGVHLETAPREALFLAQSRKEDS